MAKETIEIMQDIYDENTKLSDNIQWKLTGKKIFSVNILGAPGVGKTSVLIKLIDKLKQPVTVIEGDVESDIDTKTLRNLNIPAYQINTHGGCHLDAPMLSKAIDEFPIKENSFLFIENIGNLICPAEFEIGEHIKILICSTTDGSDKPYKYPLAFEKANAVIVNKSDLLPYTDFNRTFFIEGIKKHNKNSEIFFTSSKNDDGFDEIAKWLLKYKTNIMAV